MADKDLLWSRAWIPPGNRKPPREGAGRSVGVRELTSFLISKIGSRLDYAW